MRVLVVSIGTYGDVLPFLGVAAELRRRGHEVTLASAATFEMAARRAGVPFVALTSAEDYAALFEHKAFWRPFTGARRLFLGLSELLRPTYDFIASRYREGETVVIASSLALGARVAQEKLGAPLATLHLTPIMFISRDAAPRIPYLPLPDWLPATAKWKIQTGLYNVFIAPLLKPGLNAFRNELGLKPLRRIRKWWHSPDRLLLMFPSWFAPVQRDWPKRVVQFDFPRADRLGAVRPGLDPKLDAFLKAGEAPVVVTFGSTLAASDHLYRTAAEACGRVGRRCLILSHHPVDLSADLGETVFAARYAPLGDVLPRAAALIHHGGVGTTALALQSGAPQIVVPAGFDQYDHAARVRALGCGIWMSRRAFRTPQAADALAALLGSAEIAANCAAVAAKAGTVDAISAACDAIESDFADRLTPAAVENGAPRDCALA